MGNGLAQRCAMWHEVLAGLGPVTTVVAPVAGPVAPGTDEFLLGPSDDWSPAVPRLAQGLTVRLGDTAVDGSPGRPTAPSSSWRSAPTWDSSASVCPYAFHARLLVDLDDGDAAFFRSIGEDAKAAQFESLIEEVSRTADIVVSTQGFKGTRAVPDSVRIPATVRRPGRWRRGRRGS